MKAAENPHATLSTTARATTTVTYHPQVHDTHLEIGGQSCTFTSTRLFKESYSALNIYKNTWHQGPLLLTWINLNPNMDK